MREIKFRAYLPKCNKMAYGMEYDGDLADILEDDGKNYIVMQYTGLKDDKGKEVYEGDILSIDCYSYTEPEDCIGGVVVYDNNHLCFALKASGYDEDLEYVPLMEIRGSYRTIYEVIGNIYENKDCLERLF